MSSQTKTQILNEIYALLRRRYKVEPRSSRLSVLEAIVFGICNEGTTFEQANQALSRFKDHFFDWNEVRVSTLQEIEDVLAGLPEPAQRAIQLRRFLRQLFEKTYGFNLDALAKKPMKDALKALAEYDAIQSDYVLATIIHKALGGHAIPIDGPIRRALERLGVADRDTDEATLRSLLERAIPKNRGAEFALLLEELCVDTCVDDPECPRCELRKICPTGQARILADRKPRPAARVSASASKTHQAKTSPNRTALPAPPARERTKKSRPTPVAKKPHKPTRKDQSSRSAAQKKRRPR
jgi:endonuclease-3